MTSSDDERPTSHGPHSSHPDNDTLATLALGDPVAPDVSAHLEGCGQCRAYVEALVPVVQVARTLEPSDVVPFQPPPDVWQRIAAEAGLEPARPMAVAEPTADSPAEPIQTLRPSPVEPVADPAPRPVVRRRAVWLAAAAVVGAVLGTSATLGWQALHDDKPTVVASATLQPLPAKHGSGTAEVENATSGRELSVRVQGTAPQGSFLEVWLMSDPQHLISLGVMDTDAATFSVPPGIDLDTYKVVDVSIEPYDGNPAHSSDSLVRGTLTRS